VSFAEAALGGVARVPSLENDETTLPLDIPPGTQPGAIFTVKGQGIPRLDGRGRGSIIVAIQVDVPAALSARAKSLLAELDAELRGAAPSEPQRKVAGK
jgi:molecular chaperone DnaJ